MFGWCGVVGYGFGIGVVFGVYVVYVDVFG